MKTVIEPVYLYILMRTDMWSMNPGKQAAQACHGANQMVWEIGKQKEFDDDGYDAHTKNLLAWQGDRGFGTTITLGVNEREMRETVAAVEDSENIFAGIVHDPTYPIQDGERLVHLIPVDTCAYLFGEKRYCNPYVRHYELLD